MSQIRGVVKSLKVTLGGRYLLEIEAEGDVRGVFDKYSQKDCDIEIKKHREKRSLDANSYMWVLCDKLARKINSPKITKEEIYRTAIREVGIFKDFGNLSEKDAETLMTAWQLLGTGWIAEQVDYEKDGEHVRIRCYYGSSKYNTKQMSRLLDWIIAECKEQGIETATPDEIARMKALWGEAVE